MKVPLLLLACSAAKLLHVGFAPARDLYRGVLVQRGLRLAERRGWDVLILSALHGWVEPDRVIQLYDHMIKGIYRGPWPDGRGFYIGADRYFRHAPDRFKPLLKEFPVVNGRSHNSSIVQLARLNRMLAQ